MVRFIVAPLLLLAVAFVASVEGRVEDPVLRPINGTNSVSASISNVWIVARKLLTSDVRPVAPLDTSLLDDSTSGFRKLTGEDECQRTCDQVHFKTMCRSLTRMPGVTTPRELLQAAVRAAIGKAKLAKRRVDEYAASSHEGNPMASILETCGQAYDNVAQALEETQQLIDAHPTHADLMSKVSAVNTFAVDCDNAFEERPEIKSPFAAAQRNVYRLVDNVLNIAYFVKQV